MEQRFTSFYLLFISFLFFFFFFFLDYYIRYHATRGLTTMFHRNGQVNIASWMRRLPDRSRSFPMYVNNERKNSTSIYKLEKYEKVSNHKSAARAAQQIITQILLLVKKITNKMLLLLLRMFLSAAVKLTA